ncbi:MAG: hypothetical protein IPG91_08920 [Ideonella sp.]|nr:hypothetical protein [Ideonella sp.]
MAKKPGTLRVNYGLLTDPRAPGGGPCMKAHTADSRTFMPRCKSCSEVFGIERMVMVGGDAGMVSPEGHRGDARDGGMG